MSETAMVRGHELLRQGQLEEAQQVLQTALSADPTNSRLMAVLALAHFRAGAFDPARAIYEQLTEQFPTEASHHLNLGLAHLKLGNATGAVEALEKSRTLDPSQGRTVRYLGLAYARAGRFGHAYRAFLLAGQPDLANEVAQNIAAAERGSIHAELLRSGIPNFGNDVLANTASSGAVASHAPTSSERSESTPRGSAPVQQSSSTSHRSRISAALRIATPSSASATHVTRDASGAKSPIPLSQFATEALVRADDGLEVFEVANNGALVIRLTERLYTRLDGVHVTSGSLAFQPTMRRRHGRQTTDHFDCGGSQLHTVSGQGYLIAMPGKRTFTAVALDDDVLYMREDLVFAFEAELRWENGYVPGLRDSPPFVQFRGDGAVALRCERPLVRIKLSAEAVIAVEAKNLAGWVGRVIPRVAAATTLRPEANAVVECSGEGVILVEPTPHERSENAERSGNPLKSPTTVGSPRRPSEAPADPRKPPTGIASGV